MTHFSRPSSRVSALGSLAASLTALTAIGSFTAPARAQAGDCLEGWIPSQNLLDGPVLCAAFLPGPGSGSLVLGGIFGRNTGATPSLNIVQYDIETGQLSPLGAGLQILPYNPNSGEAVYAVTVLNGPAAGDIVATGIFNTPGSGIARYNSATGWAGIGLLQGEGSALLTLPGGDVIVGGQFTSAGGVPARNIARYSPTTGAWSALGSGTTGQVYALALLPNGDLAVGGPFTSAGGVPVTARVARYNPTTNVWSSMGAIPNVNSVFQVNAFAVLPGGDVIAGALDANGRSLFRYSAAAGTWTSVGNTGIGGPVWTLAALPGGDVLAGGTSGIPIDPADSTPYNLGRYNPITGAVSEFAHGTNGSVSASLLLPGGDLMVAGGFSQVGDRIPSNSVARYRSPGARPSITVQPAPATAVQTGQATFYVGASAPGGTIRYQWRKNASPISIAGNPSAATPALQLTNVQFTDAGTYDCVLTGACNGLSTISQAAALAVRSACPADTDDGSGAGTPDGGVTIEDLLYFLERFAAGC